MFTPANPVLASSLLDASNSTSSSIRDPHSSTCTTSDGGRRWDLTEDIELGISHPKSVLSSGRVIGISGLWPGHEKQVDEGDIDIQAWVYHLSLYFLATALSTRHDHRVSDRPRVIVVQYYECRQLTREDLQILIRQRLPECSDSEIENLLGSIQIYRVYDFDEIQDAVDQVSDLLFDCQKQRQDTLAEANSTGQHTGTETGDVHTSYKDKPEHTLLIVEGLDRSLEEIIRASNPGAGHSRLVPLFRTLTILSRAYAPFLTVVVVNSINLPRRSASSFSPLYPKGGTSKLDPAKVEGSAEGKARGSAHSDISTTNNSNNNSHLYASVDSIFPDTTVHVHVHDSLPISYPSTFSYSSLLARSLDQGYDTHLLVSKFEDSIIVEVAKDRLGDGLGRWCVYS